MIGISLTVKLYVRTLHGVENILIFVSSITMKVKEIISCVILSLPYTCHIISKDVIIFAQDIHYYININIYALYLFCKHSHLCTNALLLYESSVRILESFC